MIIINAVIVAAKPSLNPLASYLNSTLCVPLSTSNTKNASASDVVSTSLSSINTCHPSSYGIDVYIVLSSFNVTFALILLSLKSYISNLLALNLSYALANLSWLIEYT